MPVFLTYNLKQTVMEREIKFKAKSIETSTDGKRVCQEIVDDFKVVGNLMD